MRSMDIKRPARVWAAGLGVLAALSLSAAGVYAQSYKADALLSVEMSRSAVVEKIAAAWEKEIPLAQTQALKAKLSALRADQLLAASLSATFDGVLEVLSVNTTGATAHALPSVGSANTFFATQSERTSTTQQGKGIAQDIAKAVGDVDKDLVFTPLTPCRLHDSRAGQASALGVLGGVMANQTLRTLAAGGKCGIPATGVRSIFLSFHAYNNNPAALGIITFQKTGDPVSGLASAWTGGVWTTGTAITGTLDNGSFDVFVGNGEPMSADMIIDVMGYFSPANRGGDGLRVIGAGTANAVSVVNGESNNTVGTAVGATIAGGFSNSATGNSATVGGGGGNKANGGSSTIGGGGGVGTNCYDALTTLSDQPCWNEASGSAATVGGGLNNRAELNGAVVGGGEGNRASGYQSVVAGGSRNTVATATYWGAVVSGLGNTVSGSSSFIGSGVRNQVAGTGSSIVGGGGGKILGGSSNFMGSGGINDTSTCYDDVLATNTAPCWNEIAATAGPSSIVGGYNNRTDKGATFIGGGYSNVVAQGSSGIVAGSTNRIGVGGVSSFIGAGANNSVSVDKSGIVGGRFNSITDTADSGAFIGAGRGNIVSGARSAIVGGGSEGLACWNPATGLFDLTCANRAEGRRNFIGAGTGNRTANSESAIVGGVSNVASGLYSIVGSGIANTASGERSIVVGGGSFSLNTCYNRATNTNDAPCQNIASGVRSTIVGGVGNIVAGQDGFVGAGSSNQAPGLRAVAVGGINNTASGLESSIIGGRTNVASGAFSFAGGRNAKTETIDATPVVHHGTFVWADSGDDGVVAGTAGQPFRSSAASQFAVRARGGVVFKVDATTIAANAGDATAGCSLPSGGAASWSCSSDRNLKDGIKAISPKDVLSKVVNLPLSTWQFKGTSRRHLSPMAQDFWAAFGFGEDDRHITASDVSGVALAAVQGVNQKMNDELASLKAKNVALQKTNDAMQRELAAIKKKLGL